VALAVGWATYRPTDAEDFRSIRSPRGSIVTVTISIASLTLGFGNKISPLAMMTDASSVDGEWNSGRMLPELTRYGAGALTSSKYFGEPGLDALRAMLKHADHYGLKWSLSGITIMTRCCLLPAGAKWTVLKTGPSPCGAKTGYHRLCR